MTTTARNANVLQGGIVLLPSKQAARAKSIVDASDIPRIREGAGQRKKNGTLHRRKKLRPKLNNPSFEDSSYDISADVIMEEVAEGDDESAVDENWDRSVSSGSNNCTSCTNPSRIEVSSNMYTCGDRELSWCKAPNDVNNQPSSCTSPGPEVAFDAKISTDGPAVEKCDDELSWCDDINNDQPSSCCANPEVLFDAHNPTDVPAVGKCSDELSWCSDDVISDMSFLGCPDDTVNSDNDENSAESGWEVLSDVKSVRSVVGSVASSGFANNSGRMTYRGALLKAPQCPPDLCAARNATTNIGRKLWVGQKTMVSEFLGTRNRNDEEEGEKDRNDAPCASDMSDPFFEFDTAKTMRGGKQYGRRFKGK